MEPRFYARSASDNTGKWPFWFVADRMQSGLNVTQELRRLRNDPRPDISGLGLIVAGFALQPFCHELDATDLAEWANGALGDAPRALWAERVLQ